MKKRYFGGNEVSQYGVEHGYVDYKCLAKCFDGVLNNNIMSETFNIGYWELINGSDMWYWDDENDAEIAYEDIESWDNISEQCVDVYQYFIISYAGYRLLSDYTDELVWYNEKLDMYVWGVTHCGTSWDYVLTDIKLEA